GLAPQDSSGVVHPKDFRQADLKAKVESIEGARARIRLSGNWQAQWLLGGEKEFPFACSASAEGIAIYDLEAKSMRSFLLVFSGTVWRGALDEVPKQGVRETGGVVEWTLEPSAKAQGLDVSEIGESPSRKVVIVSPGAYKAVVYQEAGGGIMEFYDL